MEPPGHNFTNPVQLSVQNLYIIVKIALVALWGSIWSKGAFFKGTILLTCSIEEGAQALQNTRNFALEFLSRCLGRPRRCFPIKNVARLGPLLLLHIRANSQYFRFGAWGVLGGFWGDFGGPWGVKGGRGGSREAPWVSFGSLLAPPGANSCPRATSIKGARI